MGNFLERGMYNKIFPGVLAGWEKKKSDDYHSKYVYECNGAVIAISPSASVYKALHLYAGITKGTINYAGTGRTKQDFLVAEIQNTDSDGDIVVDVVAINKKGLMYGAQFNTSTLGSERYAVGDAKRGGTAFFLALMPEVLKDQEASDSYNKIENYLLKDYDDASLENDDLYAQLNILTENIYYRFVYKQAARTDYRLISPNANSGGQTNRFNQAMIDTGEYNPEKYSAGNFIILVNTGASSGNGFGSSVVAMDMKTFRTTYSLERQLTEEEKKMIPVPKEGWILDDDTLRLCQYVKKTSSSPEKMRNFFLSGPSGTGKTTCAEMMAYGLGLPKVTITCNANTEIFDFTSQVVPASGDADTSAILDKDNKINVTALCEELGLPTLEDIHWDTEGSYFTLTGKDMDDGVTEEEVTNLLLQALIEKVKPVLSSGNSQFRVQESPFIAAIENGWLVELQEPTAIVQQGVLVGLNSLMEMEGNITLPNGRVIKRHPDAIVVMTSNLDYFGCDAINQSVISRMDVKITKDNPPYEVMAKRAMGRTGFSDESFAIDMAKMVCDISNYCRSNGIMDGVCDQRSLNSWMLSVMVDGKAMASRNLIGCVVEKATMDKSEQQGIIDSVIAPTQFAS